jgi:hypothetical protein
VRVALAQLFLGTMSPATATQAVNVTVSPATRGAPVQLIRNRVLLPGLIVFVPVGVLTVPFLGPVDKHGCVDVGAEIDRLASRPLRC